MPLYILSTTTSGSAHGQLMHTKVAEIDVEEHLENWLENSPTILLDGKPILWIGRQPSAPVSGTVLFPDLLGLDSAGNLIVVELKRGRTPRDVVAQGLEYLAWASKLEYQDLERVTRENWARRGQIADTLESVFRDTLLAGDEITPLPRFNQCQTLFIVAEEIHPRVAEVARYLQNPGGLDVRCIVFSVYRAASGETLVSVDTVVGEPPGRAGNGVLPDDKTAGDIIYETVKKLLNQPGKDQFGPSEIYHEILKAYPQFNQGTTNAQITANCVNRSSRRHYPGRKADLYFWVSRGIYQLYDPQRDGMWDQEGNPVKAASEPDSVLD